MHSLNRGVLNWPWLGDVGHADVHATIARRLDELSGELQADHSLGTDLVAQSDRIAAVGTTNIQQYAAGRWEHQPRDDSLVLLCRKHVPLA